MSVSTLRFLADESCDFAIVRALRAQGYDVLAVSVVQPGHIRISHRPGEAFSA
jgi:hypothetical protein